VLTLIHSDPRLLLISATTEKGPKAPWLSWGNCTEIYHRASLSGGFTLSDDIMCTHSIAHTTRRAHVQLRTRRDVHTFNCAPDETCTRSIARTRRDVHKQHFFFLRGHQSRGVVFSQPQETLRPEGTLRHARTREHTSEITELVGGRLFFKSVEVGVACVGVVRMCLSYGSDSTH
jgi:hypothetical protein